MFARILFTTFLLVITGAIKLEFEDKVEYDVIYTSKLDIQTTHPQYYYKADSIETQSLIIEKIGSNYEFTLRTVHFRWNISEFNKTDQIHDSKSATEEEIASNPLFHTIVKFTLSSQNGATIHSPMVLDDESFDETTGEAQTTMPRTSQEDLQRADALSLRILLSFYQTSKKISINKDTQSTLQRWKGKLFMPRQTVEETYSVVFKPKKQTSKNKANNEKVIDIKNGRLLGDDPQVQHASLHGKLSINLDTGIVSSLKLMSVRDVEDPKVGPHRLNEEMTLSIKPKASLSQAQGEETKDEL